MNAFKKAAGRVRSSRRNQAQARRDLAQMKDLLLAQSWGLLRDRSENPLTAIAERHWSQSDEDGILRRLCSRMSLNGPGTFIEFGVGDGLENNTLALLARGWRGVWVGGQPLSFEIPERARLRFQREWIRLDNLDSIVARALDFIEQDQPDVISLDLDGNDYHFAQRILQSGVHPKIWIAEYQGRMPLGVQWVMPYDADHRWDGSDYYGASFTSFCDLFTLHGYSAVACSVTGVNVFFVRNDVEAELDDVPIALERIYVPPVHVLRYSERLGHRTSPRTVASMIEEVTKSSCGGT